MKILFVGGGNMCQAIIGGLVATGTSAADIHVIEPLLETRALLDGLGVSAAGEFADRDLAAEVIVLAVKPQMMKAAITPLAGKLASQLVVSIAAGIRSADIGRLLSAAGATPTATSYGNIVRAMPNTPALIRAGITGLFASPAVGASGRKQAETLLAVVGKIAWFDDEAMLDAVTAVSGSGPAYVFYFIEALEQGAREMGFDELTAREFALQTFLGGARLAAGSAESPAVLQKRVTSKGGTTERAIEAFDTFHVREHIIEGVKAAGERSRQLGEEMSAISSGELGCEGKLKGKN